MTKPRTPARKEPKKAPATRGRPSAYRKEFAKQAAKLCDLGATDIELAEFFEVSVRTIHMWKEKHPEFLHSIKAGKDHADERVIRSLYQRAVGYSFESEKVFQHDGAVVRADIIQHVPPDVTAGIYWLNNRQSETWRTRKAVEASGPGGGPIEHRVATTDGVIAAMDRIAEALK